MPAVGDRVVRVAMALPKEPLALDALASSAAPTADWFGVWAPRAKLRATVR